MPKKTKNLRSYRVFSAVCLLVVATCVLFAIFGLDRTALIDNIIGANFTPSSELSELSSRISLTKVGTRILRATHPELQAAEDFNQNCSATRAEASVLGCYFNGRIYIYDIKNEELTGIKESILAHELLHAVWARTSSTERDILKSALDATYQENQATLSTHMKNYDRDEYYDELHSLIGTQLSSSTLPESLKAHYAQIFLDQEKIVTYFNDYNQKFTALRARLEALSAEITKNRARIAELKATYEDVLSRLDQDISDFNALAGSGSLTAAAFDSRRAALLARQSALEDQYAQLSGLVVATNQLIDEYNQSAASANALSESINSKLDKPTPAPSL